MKQLITQELVEKALEVFYQACPELQASQDRADMLRAQLQVALADQLTPPVARKEVSILLSDLRGFSEVAERFTPFAVIELLNRYFSRMNEIILHHGGTIDKFMGDAIMVLFGAHDAREGDLKNAVACAVDMQIAMDELNQGNEDLGFPPLYMGIGINTGNVVAGPVGSDLHSEYTVIGNEVNLASRIEAQSLRGQVLISEHTYQLGDEFIEVGTVNEVYVKGHRAPVKLYEVRAISAPERRVVPRCEARRSPRIEVHMGLTFQCVTDGGLAADVHRGEVVDISYYGMAARLPVLLPPLTEIRVDLNLSMMGGQTSALHGRVLRAKEDQGGFLSSIEFTSIDPTAQLAIKHFIDRIIDGR